MREAFSDRADFSGMTASRELKISDVIHRDHPFLFVRHEQSGAILFMGRLQPRARMTQRRVSNAPLCAQRVGGEIFFTKDNKGNEEWIQRYCRGANNH